ncbi:MAG TPA: hypothetical protein PLF22_08480 [Pseudomonadales bacterium]|nr:hypothetical protein [Pseudomonadales bacterium]
MIDFTPVSVSALHGTEITAADLADRQTFLSAAQQASLQNQQPTDAAALHCFASLNDRRVGYLRINADGQLSVIGCTANPHDDVIAALLRFAVLESPRHDISSLTADTAFGHLGQLQALGFEKYRDAWRLMLPPDRTRQQLGSELVRLEHMHDFRNFSLQLVNNTQRNLAIYSEDLEAWLYDHEDFVDAVMNLAQRSRYSEIRIIVRDTRALLENGHRLLRASHRASEKIHIRKLTAVSGKQPSYLLADDGGMLFRPDPDIILGIGYTDYRSRVKPLREQFDLMWSSAYEDADLRRLTV